MAEGKKTWAAGSRDFIDVSTFGSPDRTYLVTRPITGTFATGANFTVTYDEVDLEDKKKGVQALPSSTGFAPYMIEGSFQGRHFRIGALDLIEDDPIEAVMEDVLGLGEDEVLVGISYLDKDGNVQVRPWYVE